MISPRKHLGPRAVHFLLPLCSVIWAHHSGAQTQDAGITFFETRIRPVLVAECLECHGAEKTKGGLRLDSRPGWQRGGDSGAVIVAGKPQESLLLRSIRHEEPDLKMPDKAPKLDAAILKDFEAWIGMGAPDPRDGPPSVGERAVWADLLAVRRKWWSFQPLTKTDDAVPLHKAIDARLRETAEHAGLSVNGPASSEAVLRRLHLVLNGLPPSIAEGEAFALAWARDPMEAIRATAKDLLGRRAFGEHMARRWMDLFRYADSHGSEGDPEIPGAYQFRDYLIRAFNSDVPLDHLIKEHLAGDLLKEPRRGSDGSNESAIGPAHFRMVEHGYQPVDALDDRVKVVDNQIDVITKAFQGLTVSCARCHDHKFDAVSQRDYTALYGVLASARPAQIEVHASEAIQRQQGALSSQKKAIREGLAAHWVKVSNRLTGHLRERLQPPSAPDLDAVRAELTRLESELASKAWAQICGRRGESPAPYALWNFQRGSGDVFGRVRSEMVGGATVEGGRLVLNGTKAYVRSEPLPIGVGEKTFEAWLTLDNLEQRGGGVLSIERVGSHGFDSLVFAEKEAGRWVAGSDYFKRSENVGGDVETAKASDRIHLAVSYASDGTVTMYRNGKVYGKSFRKGDLLSYEPKDGRLLIGLRHTGAGNGHLRAKVEEARFYVRALRAEEIAASFGAGTISTLSTGAGASGDAQEIAALEVRVEALRKRVAELTPAAPEEPLAKLSSAPEHPLHAAMFAITRPAEFRSFYPTYRERMLERIDGAHRFNAENFEVVQDLSQRDEIFSRSGPDVGRVLAGDFRVNPKGERVIDGILPAGVGSGGLTGMHGGAVGTRDLVFPDGGVSVRYSAVGGTMLRLVPSDYPLTLNAGAPRITTSKKEQGWLRMDTAYRAGVKGHVELATPDYQMRRGDGKGAGTDVPAFVLERVLKGNGKDVPREELPALEAVLRACSSPDADLFLSSFRDRLSVAIRRWVKDEADAADAALLDMMVRSQAFPSVLSDLPGMESAVAAYRGVVAGLPAPRIVPGLSEAVGTDAPFLPRGDHKKPGETVPRGYLEVLDPAPIRAEGSGRIELAQRMTDSRNPLTPRVMANRVWAWVFGDGLIPTPDNLGKMGVKPDDMVLVDLVASRLQRGGWSLKTMLMEMVLTEAFRRGGKADEVARRTDPSNRMLTHAPVRRLEAECIRDAMLKVAGLLEEKEQGPPVVGETRRRSLYLLQKRNSLPAFLTTFDAPKPFTTVGRRDVTTVPSQSLTLLNDPTVIRWAGMWAQRVMDAVPDTDGRLEMMFREALGRRPLDGERQSARSLLRDGAGVPEWTAVAHAIFNLKEFIYLR